MAKKKGTEELKRMLDLIKLSEIFPEPMLDSLALRSYKKGDVLFRDGEIISELFFIVSGRIKVYKELANGAVVSYRFYHPGEVIGDVEFFSRERCTASLCTTAPVSVISVSYAAVDRRLAHCSQLLLFLGKSLAEKLVSNSIAVAINSCYSLEKRILMYLVHIKSMKHLKEKLPVYCENQKELSELLGTSYRNLNRVLATLESKGLIFRAEGELEICESEITGDEFENEFYQPGQDFPGDDYENER